MRPAVAQQLEEEVWSLMRRFFSSTSARGRPVSSARRLAMRSRALPSRPRAGDAGRAGSPRRRRPRPPRAPPRATPPSAPLSWPWYCATLAKAGRNSAYGRSLRGAKTMRLQVHRAGDEDQARTARRPGSAACRRAPRRASCRSSRRPGRSASPSAGAAPARRASPRPARRRRRRPTSSFLRASSLDGDRVAGVRRVDEDQVEVLEPGDAGCRCTA